MENQISLMDNIYQFKEQFDVNLTLDYENNTWCEWHVLREFISNALDSVSNDISKILLQIESGFVYIRDFGNGYPLVYAKRIGASIKKDEASSIGQFGEGIKLAMLTCIRNNIKVMLASKNWLIKPKAVEMESQQILMYDIFETEASIDGTVVIVEANEKITEILNNIDQYFLHFNQNNFLFGSLSGGIYPIKNGIAKLYNKGVYVKDINALYSYAISIEKLNRDRDFISNSDAAYMIRDMWQEVDDEELLKVLIITSTMPYEQRNKYIEFYASIYATHPEAWAKAFQNLYGKNTVLFTNDIACREAEVLGYKVIKVEYNIAGILERGSIKKDANCLSEDYEFTFANNLDNNEQQVIDRLYTFAKLINLDIPENVRVFETYQNDSDIPGLYNFTNEQIYLRRNILDSDFSTALCVFLHEANHHITKADDISRKYSESLCELLTQLLIKYEKEVGVDAELSVNPKGVVLPSTFSLTANSLYASIVLAGNELFIIIGDNTIKISLPVTFDRCTSLKRRIFVHQESFIVSLPESVMAVFKDCEKVKCKVRKD